MPLGQKNSLASDLKINLISVIQNLSIAVPTSFTFFLNPHDRIKFILENPSSLKASFYFNILDAFLMEMLEMQ